MEIIYLILLCVVNEKMNVYKCPINKRHSIDSVIVGFISVEPLLCYDIKTRTICLSFIGIFIHYSSTGHIFTEYFLCAKHCSKFQWQNRKYNNVFIFTELLLCQGTCRFTMVTNSHNVSGLKEHESFAYGL